MMPNQSFPYGGQPLAHSSAYAPHEEEDSFLGKIADIFGEPTGDDDDDDDMKLEPVPLPASTTGMAVSCIVRDSTQLLKSGSVPKKMCRLGRLCSSMCVVLLALVLQIWILAQAKMLVTPPSIDGQRQAYDKYEKAMYTDDAGVEHVKINNHGYARGINGFYNAKNFAKFSDDDKAEVCGIPLSEPTFIGTILLIWTFTCVSSITENTLMVFRILLAPNVMDMDDVVNVVDKKSRKIEVNGLTPLLKGVLSFLVSVQVLVAVYLLWLGARWLVGTNGWSDVLENTIALEFVLLFPELLFRALIPMRTQMDTENTGLPAMTRKTSLNRTTCVRTFFIFIFSMLLITIYINAQMVLPDYKWDVHQACHNWNKDLLKKVTG